MTIIVRCDQTGDTGEAPDVESAVVAARQLCEDAWNANAVQGFRPTVSFILDGVPLVSYVGEAAIWKALAR